jgi:hypothetical protein
VLAIDTPKYTVSADAHYTTIAAGKTFAVSEKLDSGLALANGKIMIVTTLADGSETFALYSISGTSQTVTVSAKAVKSTVYLINGDFNGASLPQTYTLAVFVTE